MVFVLSVPLGNQINHPSRSSHYFVQLQKCTSLQNQFNFLNVQSVLAETKSFILYKQWRGNISDGGIKCIHAYNVPKTGNLFSLSLFTAYWMFTIQGKSEQKWVYSDYKRKKKKADWSLMHQKTYILAASMNKDLDIETCCLQKGEDFCLTRKD